jgi:hypothetical protein
MKHSLVLLCVWFVSYFGAFAQSTGELRQELESIKSQYKDEMRRVWDELERLQRDQTETNVKFQRDFETTIEKYVKESGKEPLTWQDIISPKNKIKFYGFFRLDMVFDSHRTNSGNSAFFVLDHNPSGSGNDEELNIHSRLTRFGMELTGSRLATIGNPDVSGRLELDFFGGGSESRNLLRLRHAYLKLDWEKYDLSLLAGQTSDIVSPLYPHTVDLDSLLWMRGNIGDRRPQLRLEWAPAISKGQKEDETRLYFTAGLLRAGAVDTLAGNPNSDADGDGNNDGEDSGAPMVQARIGIATPSWVDNQKVRFGMWTSHAWYDTQARLGVRGEKDFVSHVYGIDLTLPITERVELATEWWWGYNVGDLRGGIGLGVDVPKGDEVEATGGWLSMKIKTTERSSVAFGYGFDNPVDGDVPAGGRLLNQTFFINNVWDLSSGVSAGVEYQYMLTYYAREDDSNYNSRFLAFIMYQF